MENINVLNTTLHHIDLSSNQVITKDPNQNEATIYIKKLIDRIIDDVNLKYFNVKSPTTEVISKILETCNNIETLMETAAHLIQESEEYNLYKDNFYIISNKLLREQIEAQEKYKQISNIKKGSLIQSVLEVDNKKIYLLALVDHDKFVDEEDLTGRNGLPYDKMALKSALIFLDDNFNIDSISITDTNRRISQYWYDGFLELVETKDDKTNTKNAYACIKQVLTKKIEKKYSADFFTLKNALDTYFCQNDTFKFDECSNFLFENYSPIDEKLNIGELKESISQLARNSQFDNSFIIDKDEIKKDLKKTYDVNRNIQLKINGPIEKLKDTIYAGVVNGDEKVIIIKSVDDKVFKLFNFENQ